MNFSRKFPRGEFQFADVADKGDVGIVDGDCKIGLVRQSRGLVRRSVATGIFFLRGILLPA